MSIVDLVHSIFTGLTCDVWPEYEDFRNRLEKEVSRESKELNSSKDDLVAEIIEKIKKYNKPQRDLTYLPWTDTTFSLDRMLSAIFSFTDFHELPIPKEFFPVDLSLEFLDRVSKKYDEQRKSVTLSEQYDIALGLCRGYELASAILVHIAFRMAARDKDKRVHPDFTLDVDYRINLANKVAFFQEDISPTKDSLGDMYHFWAQFIAGMLSQYENRLIGTTLYASFYLGPNLMGLMHKRILGQKMFFGVHEKVDRMGLYTGREIGKFVRKSYESLEIIP